QQLQVRVRVHIDETRTDEQPVCVTGSVGRFARQMADRGDAIADDADVSAHPRIAGSVDQFATTDQDVEHKTHILPNGYQTTRAAILARWPCRRGYRCFTIRGS